jgi:outer membrane protein assembly factor BamB
MREADPIYALQHAPNNWESAFGICIEKQRRSSKAPLHEDEECKRVLAIECEYVTFGGVAVSVHPGKCRSALVSLSLLLTLLARADDWPQWRGLHRDGTWDETNIVESFPTNGLKIAWRAPVGPGFSSPVVAQGRAFVIDSQLIRPKARERVHAFDTKSGKELWTHSYEVDYADWALEPTNSFGPRPTPIVNDGKLFTLGARGRLICFEAANGKVLWEKNLEIKSKDSAFTPSPLIESNLLILVLDGAPPGPCVVAMDKNSGNEVWRAIDESATFGSPIAITAGGKRQLIVWAEKSVNSLDPATGKVFWRERYVSGGSYVVSTPVARDDLLFVSGMMFKLNSDKPGASLLWPEGRPPSRQTISDTSTAAFLGDHLFTCNLAGELACIEAKTGKIAWATNAITGTKGGASIHITTHGKWAFLFNDRGELIRAGLTPAGYSETSRATLLRPTSPIGTRKMAWTPPAYSDGRVFARNDEELVCAELAGR